MKRVIAIPFLLVVCFTINAQQIKYSTANAHSHNDYEQKAPFWTAWQSGFGSIEADIFLDKNELIVAHDLKQVQQRRTLDSLYLLPLQECLKINKGNIYADNKKVLQLMIDIKTDAVPTLNKLVEKLNGYSSLVNASSLKIVISGNRPLPSEFKNWPSWILFDGELAKEYNATELEKVEMISDNYRNYSSWDGKGKLPEKDKQVLQDKIKRVHELGKKIRFWNAPDNTNSWYNFASLGVDYINTDRIEGLFYFFRQWPDRMYVATENYTPYKPQWKNDGMDKPVKNVIILIGDGTGLAQWYAGYTANSAALNVFNMRYIGLSKTSSYDNYITDSAPGATALSSGTKTNNRAIGVDHTGARLVLLPDIIEKKKMKAAILTSGELQDATPASFYGHRRDRKDYKGMLEDLATARVDIIMGACDLSKTDSIASVLKKKFTVLGSVNEVNKNTKLPLIVADATADLSMLDGRKDWAQKAFQSSIDLLTQDKSGFLLMLEGAQIDHGGHGNNLPYAVSELLDFDQVIGKAMEFADSNGETLIIVTGDHETGGLTLTGGDYSAGYINGQFSTSGHTAIPVPVFAYGPQSQLFSGVYENTDIFFRILKALKLK